MDKKIIRRVATVLEQEFGSDWLSIAQQLGTENLRQRVGKELTSFMTFPERGIGGNNQWRDYKERIQATIYEQRNQYKTCGDGIYSLSYQVA